MTDDLYRQKRRVTLVGAVGNVVLTIGKIGLGVLGQSQALVADGIHSLSDLVSDVVVLYAAHVGRLEADHNHPYGHKRFETVATVGIGLLLIIVAAGFIYDATQRVLNPATLFLPSWFVLPVAVASVLIKELMYHYTIRVGRKVRSKLIEANAWHHRSDRKSTLIVIVRVAGVLAEIGRAHV